MSVPSASLNLSSIQSSPPAISLSLSIPHKTQIQKRIKSLRLFFLWGISSNTRYALFHQIQPKSSFVENFKTQLLKEDSLQKETDFILFGTVYEEEEEQIQLCIIEGFFDLRKKRKRKKMKRDALGLKGCVFEQRSTDFFNFFLSLSEILLRFDFSTLG